MSVRYVRITSPAAVRIKLRAAVIPVLRNGAYRVEADWRNAIPHDWPGVDGHVTGNSGRSITTHFPTQLEATVWTTHLPAKVLETGARAHVIRAKKWRHGWIRRNTSALVAWPASRGGAGPPGKWRVRREAHHPGVKSRSYGYYALLHVRGFLDRQFAAAIASL